MGFQHKREGLMSSAMIQVIGYREYTDKNTGEVKLRNAFYNNNVRSVSVESLFANIKEIVEKFPEDQRWNLHYTLGAYFEGKGPREKFSHQDVLPIDIDGIDTTKLNDYIEIVCNILNLDATKTGIVASGNGLHFLIKLKHTILNEEYFKENAGRYKTICDLINSALENKNLSGSVDPNVFRVTATLRLPMTDNIKPTGTKKCRMIQFNIEDQDFDFEAFESKLMVKELKTKKTQDLYSGYHDTSSVLNGCNFLVWCRENPNAVTEPQWLAMIGVLAYLEDGRVLVHDYSKNHIGYSMSETDAKLTSVLENTTGPRTCENINTLSDKCATCKYAGQVTTPASIKSENFVRSKNNYFHDIVITETGAVKIGKPNYADLLQHFKNEFEYVVVDGNFYIYEKTHWKAIKKEFIVSWIAACFGKHRSASKIREFYEGWLATENVEDGDFFVRNQGLTNCKNGVFDFTKGKLYPHDKKYGFTYCFDYNYDPEATCPTFDKVMKDITCHRQELENVLLEYFGYAFSNMRMKWHKCLVLLGDGSNGKSTLLQTIKKLAGVGNGCSILNLSEMNKETYRMDLVGKLFNVSEETPKRSLEDSSLFKSLVGGEGYKARNLYGSPITLNENRTKLIMAANSLPYNNDASAGFFRRFIIVPFDAIFSPKNADYNIHEKLEAELSGVLNRIKEGYDRLIAQNGFTDSAVIREATEEYSNETDNVRGFFVDCIEEVEYEESFVSNVMLYKAYVQYLKDNNKPVSIAGSQREFSHKFSKLAFKDSDVAALKRKNNGIRGYRNIKLIDYGMPSEY